MSQSAKVDKKENIEIRTKSRYNANGIQPNGYLIVATLNGMITDYSSNLVDLLLSFPPESPHHSLPSSPAKIADRSTTVIYLGKYLQEVIHPDNLDSFLQASQELGESDSQFLGEIQLVKVEKSFSGYLHRTAKHWLLELIPVVEQISQTDWLKQITFTTRVLKLADKHLKNGSRFEEFVDEVLEPLRHFLGYDRLCLYRLAPNQDSEVIAESRTSEVESLKNLWFPSWNIPQQAREVLVKTGLRTITDCQLGVVPLLPVLDSEKDEVDLNYVHLREVSDEERHLLERLGMRSLVSAAIIIDNQLWGLLMGQHRQAYHLDPTKLLLLEKIATILASEVPRFALVQTDKKLQLANRVFALLATELEEQNDWVQYLIDPNLKLVQALEADGLVILQPTRAVSLGGNPAAASLDQLRQYLDSLGYAFWYTDHLDKKSIRGLSPWVGAMAIKIPLAEPSWIVWFRKESPRMVNWYFDPAKPEVFQEANVEKKVATVLDNHPDRSFESFEESSAKENRISNQITNQEKISGYSRPWATEDIRVVTEVFRPKIMEGLIRQRHQIQKLHSLQEILLTQIADAVVVLDHQQRIIFWNEAATHLYQWTAGEMIDRLLLSRFPKEMVPEDPVLQEILLGNRDYLGEFQDYRKDGSRVWVQLRKQKIVMENGNERWLIITRDISKQRHNSEQLRLMESIILNARDAILISEAEPISEPGPRILFVNPIFEKMTGYKNEEVIGRSPRFLQGPNTDKKTLRQIREHLLQWKSIRAEILNYRKDGSEFWVELDIFPLANEKGRYTHWVAIQREIDERKQMQIRLKKSQELLREALSRGRLGIWNWDVESDLLEWDRSHYLLYGLKPRENEVLPFSSILERIYPDDRSILLDQLAICNAQQSGFSCEYRIVWPDGSIHWIFDCGSYVFSTEGTLLGMSGMVQDITDRKKNELALAAREKQLSLVLDQMPIGCLMIDSEYRFTYWNTACQEIFGYSAAEVISKSAFDTIIPNKSRSYVQSLLKDLFQNEHEVVGVNINQTKEGNEIWCRWHNVPLYDKDGKNFGILAMVQDITKLKETEEKLEKTNRYYHLVLNSMQDVISLHDKNGHFQFITPSSESMNGYRPEELIGKSPELLFHPDELSIHANAIQANRNGAFSVTRWRCCRKDKTIIWVETATQPILDEKGELSYAICTSKNITQQVLQEQKQQQLQDQLRHAQKLEAVGQLAGGIAHDFNNLLTAVIGYTSLLLEDLQNGHPHFEIVREIQRVGERGAALVQQMLAFGRKQLLQMANLDLNQVVQEVRSLLLRLIGEHIQFNCVLAPEPIIIWADRFQLEQVLMNLVINARDAMPNGGRLQLQVGQVEHPGGVTLGLSDLPAGRYAQVIVSDNGIGMDEETMSHLFEPFFTTKEVGKGTGLGLAVVYGIIAQSKGMIGCESKLGKGSSFYIYLPCQDRIDAPKPNSIPYEVSEIPNKTSFSVLLVEDDPSVRMLTLKVLEQAGFQVWVCESGPEALQKMETDQPQIDLLITDVVMPEMGGGELAQILTKKYPGLKVLYVSGYTKDEVIRQGVEADQFHLLQKPFSPQQLLSRIEKLCYPT